MIRILHICPKGDSSCARYASLLTEMLIGQVESVVVDDLAEAQQMCKEWKPDIIHQHSDIPVPNDYRLVITAHGTIPKSEKAYVVIARSQLEASRLKAPRMEIVRNPLITKTTTADEMALKMMHIYHRVMDSNVLELMNGATRQALSELIKVGICGDSQWIGHPINLTDVNLRQLSIYACQENILHLVKEGLMRVCPTARLPENPENIESYLPQNYHKPESLVGFSIVSLLQDIKKNGPTLRRLIEIEMVLYDPSLDEERLLEQIESENLTSLFCSLLHLLNELTLLDEGFMPCHPVNDGETRRLREQIVNHLKI